jgi:hypothetical protein
MCTIRIASYILYAVNSVMMFLSFFVLIIAGLRAFEGSTKIIPMHGYYVIFAAAGIVSLVSIGGVCATCYQVSELYQEWKNEDSGNDDYDYDDFQDSKSHKSCFLLVYALLCFIGFVLTVVGVGVVFSFQGYIQDERARIVSREVKKHTNKADSYVTKQVTQLTQDARYKANWIAAQEEFKCCGYDGGDNKTETGPCCGTTTCGENPPSCKKKLLDAADTNIEFLGYLTAAVATLQFLAFCAAVHLRCCARTIDRVTPFSEDEIDASEDGIVRNIGKEA